MTRPSHTFPRICARYILARAHCSALLRRAWRSIHGERAHQVSIGGSVGIPALTTFVGSCQGLTRLSLKVCVCV